MHTRSKRQWKLLPDQEKLISIVCFNYIIFMFLFQESRATQFLRWVFSLFCVFFWLVFLGNSCLDTLREGEKFYGQTQQNLGKRKGQHDNLNQNCNLMQFIFYVGIPQHFFLGHLRAPTERKKRGTLLYLMHEYERGRMARLLSSSPSFYAYRMVLWERSSKHTRKYDHWPETWHVYSVRRGIYGPSTFFFTESFSLLLY